MKFNLALMEGKNKIISSSEEVELKERFKSAAPDTAMRPPCSFPSPMVSSSSLCLSCC